ncbi:MAG: hypothetical protein ACI87O_001584 [Planctomycetota bacterium]|jgi:hypothetical protein
MEIGIFIDSAVAEQLENNFVEARMHADTHPEFRDFELAIAKTIAQPIYIVVPADSDLDFKSESFDPTKVRILARQDGATLGDPTKFADFLKGGIDAQ